MAVSVVLSVASQGYTKGVRAPRPQPAVESPSERSAQLVAQGVLALVSRNFAQAYAALSEAYLLDHRPDTLYQLGIVAYTEGQTFLSQDLLRRYLVSAGPGNQSPQQRAEAERIVSQGQGSSGDLLIQGEPETQVYVDDRLVGMLPLPLPLLLAEGSHNITLTHGDSRQTVTVSVQAHRAYLLKTDTAANPSSAPVLSQLPTALLQVEQDLYVRTLSAQQDSHAPLLSRLEQAGLFVISAPPHRREDCKGDARCILKLTDQSYADYLLTVSGLSLDPAQSSAAQSTEARLALHDPQIGEVAAQLAVPCSPCTEAAVTESAASQLPRLIHDAVTRGRGTLALQTEPAGALVKLRNRRLGITPLRIPLFAGDIELEIVRPGYTAQTVRNEVRPGQTTQLAISLRAEETAPLIVRLPPNRNPRPKWRIATGIAGIGVGLGLVALGASALAISGQCIEPAVPPMAVCSNLYQTTPAGAALVGIGSAFTVSGALLLAWPGPRNASRPVIPPGQLESAGPWALIP